MSVVPPSSSVGPRPKGHSASRLPDTSRLASPCHALSCVALLILHFLIAHQLLDCYMTNPAPLLRPLSLTSPLHVLIYLVNCILFHFPALLTIFCCHFILPCAVKVAQLCCLPSTNKLHIGMLQVACLPPPSAPLSSLAFLFNSTSWLSSFPFRFALPANCIQSHLTPLHHCLAQSINLWHWLGIVSLPISLLTGRLNKFRGT